MGQHIAIKLTVGGGPEPQAELGRIYRASQDNADGVSWIATSKPGVSFNQRLNSSLLAVTQLSGQEVLVLTAKIVKRHSEMPDDPLARDMYSEFGDHFGAFWQIRELELAQMNKTDLPGTTTQGKRLSEAFSGHLSFAYWDPCGRSDRQHLKTSQGRLTRSSCFETDKITKPRISSLTCGRPPDVPLHGVDFSGAREKEGRNFKLWAASWYSKEKYVSLRCGGDSNGFDRRRLTERILQEGGLWVIDFPFGPPENVARAVGWDTWQDYLAWCGSDCDPTVLRNELRTILKCAGVRWSTNRKIDRKTETTWFPFFEQLYRQTITGGHDVLSRLNAADRKTVAVLPFHDGCEPTSLQSVVVEGFPGWTLKRMGFPPTGYKHSTATARDKRAAIVDKLHQSGIPICEKDRSRVIADSEGDAIDALVLLYAARCTLNRSLSDWIAIDQSSIEGWFFD